MASSWDKLGQAASVLQVTGVDAFGLVSMVVQAAQISRRNRDQCLQLAQHVQVVGDLLRELQIPELKRRPETRRPLEQLDASLFHAYKLVRSCSEYQEKRSQLHQMFTGADVASKLRLAQEEIDRYINLIPMITLVAVVGARPEVQEDVTNNDPAPAPSQRPQLSLQEVTESLTLQVVPPTVTQTNNLVGLGPGPGRFSYKELSEATKGFSHKEKIGGSGSFHRGCLRFMTEGLIHVAVKRISIASIQCRNRNIEEEVSIILSRLRHVNLVRLIGWCDEVKGELLLVYYLMTYGCLHSRLYGSRTILQWPARYRVTTGMGHALLYLHGLGMVHGEIKPSNVMLDSSFTAMLRDYGLTPFTDSFSTTGVSLATDGYMDPDLMVRDRATTGSDVYSFGVVLLEVACGRRPIDRGELESKVHLVHWVWELHGRDALLDAADPRLNGEFQAHEMERVLIVGLWCVHPDHSFRPSIDQAMHVLRPYDQAPLPDLCL